MQSKQELSTTTNMGYTKNKQIHSSPLLFFFLVEISVTHPCYIYQWNLADRNCPRKLNAWGNVLFLFYIVWSISVTNVQLLLQTSQKHIVENIITLGDKRYRLVEML